MDGGLLRRGVMAGAVAMAAATSPALAAGDGGAGTLMALKADMAQARLKPERVATFEREVAEAGIGPMSCAAPEALPANLGRSWAAMTETATGRQIAEGMLANDVWICEGPGFLRAGAPPGAVMLAAYHPGANVVVMSDKGDPEVAAMYLAHEGRHGIQKANGVWAAEVTRLTYGANHARVMAYEGDAHAVQTQVAYERKQMGHPEAWQALSRTNPGLTRSFAQAVERDAGAAGSGAALRAAYDAFVADPPSQSRYEMQAAAQWLGQAGSAADVAAVGTVDRFDGGPILATAQRDGGNYLKDFGAPIEEARTIAPGRDAVLSRFGRNLARYVGGSDDDRAALRDNAEFQAMMRTSGTSLSEIDAMLREKRSAPPVLRDGAGALAVGGAAVQGGAVQGGAVQGADGASPPPPRAPVVAQAQRLVMGRLALGR